MIFESVKIEPNFAGILVKGLPQVEALLRWCASGPDKLKITQLVTDAISSVRHNGSWSREFSEDGPKYLRDHQILVGILDKSADLYYICIDDNGAKDIQLELARAFGLEQMVSSLEIKVVTKPFGDGTFELDFNPILAALSESRPKLKMNGAQYLRQLELATAHPYNGSARVTVYQPELNNAFTIVVVPTNVVYRHLFVAGTHHDTWTFEKSTLRGQAAYAKGSRALLDPTISVFLEATPGTTQSLKYFGQPELLLRANIAAAGLASLLKSKLRIE